jgi:putative DNA primase/helicase
MNSPPVPFSEDALALAFAERFAGKFKYVHGTSPRRWFSWDAEAEAWATDSTLLHLDRIRSVCREAAAGCDDAHLARELTSASTISAVERLARCDRRLAATRYEVGLPPPKKKATSKSTRKRTAATAAEDATDDDTAVTATIADAIIARARRGRAP